MDQLSDRDFAFVEGKLLAPVPPLVEVIERLRAKGHTRDADRLMAAARALLDTCRDVRHGLIEERASSPRRIGGGPW